MSVITGGTIIEGGPPQQLSGSAAPVDGTDEVQILTITADSGTYKVGFDGWYTTAIAWGATSATLQTAMRLLPPINGANVTVTGDAPHTITFVTALGKTDVPLCTTDVSALFNSSPTAGTAVVTQSVAGITATGRGAPAGTRYTRTATGVNYTNTGTAAAPTWTTVSDSLGTSYLGSVTPGTVAASKALVVDSNKLLNELNVTGAVTIDGLVADTHSQATPTVAIRLLKSELTVTGTVSGLGTNSAAGIRGLLTIATAATSGFYYGTQGKLVADSATINIGSNHAAGIYAQASFTSGTVTSGHVAALIADVQTPPSTGAANVDGIYVEQVTGTKINSALKAIVNATYVFDLDTTGAGAGATCAPAAGTGSGSAGAATGVASRVLKVLVDGAVAYIPLFTANT